MWGHMKKDAIMMRGDIVTLIGFWLYFAIMLMVVGTGEDSIFAKYLYLIICIFPMIVTMQLSGKPISLDESSHWKEFAMALPGSKRRYIRAKYIFAGILHLFGMVLSYGYILLIRVSAECEISYFVPVIVLCVTGFLVNLELPFYFRFGYRLGGTVKGTLFLTIVMAVFLYGLFGNIEYFRNIDYNKILRAIMDIGKHKIRYIAIVTGGVCGMSVLSCLLSEKIYRS